MTNADRDLSSIDVPVIDLSKASGQRETWDRPKIVIYLWAIAELIFVANPWQISSSIRVHVLRAFGADIANEVIFRPRTRVKFPWKLHIGARSWIGEGVWFHNQDDIWIGHDVAISQDTFLTTGSHRHRRDMALITRPIFIEDGVWITSKCVVLGGARMGKSSLARPLTVIQGTVPENSVVSGADTQVVGKRFVV